MGTHQTVVSRRGTRDGEQQQYREGQWYMTERSLSQRPTHGMSVDFFKEERLSRKVVRWRKLRQDRNASFSKRSDGITFAEVSSQDHTGCTQRPA